MATDRFGPIEFKDSPFASNEEVPNPDRDLQEAESFLRENPRDIYGLTNKGVALGRLKRYRDAEETLREVKRLSLEKITPESLGQASMIAFNLASFLDEGGLEDKSEQEYLDAIDLGAKSKVPGGLVFGAMAAYDLGIQHRNKQLPDVENLMSLSIDLGKEADKPEGYFTAARAAFNLGHIKLADGKIKEFESLLTDAISFGRSAGIPRALRTATQAALKLAAWLSIIGRDKQSRELLEEAAHIGSTTDTDDTNLQASLASDLLGDNLKQAERLIDAELAYRRAINLGKLSQKDKGLEIATHASLKIGLLLDKTSFPDAQQAYQEAISISRGTASANAQQYGAAAALLLGTAFDECGQTEDAKAMYEEAIRMGDSSGTHVGIQTADQAREYLRNI
ncbi:hypothetical protein ACFLTZ_04435 [Chloroflexota bacterium]